MINKELIEEIILDESGERLTLCLQTLGEMLTEEGVDVIGVGVAFKNAGSRLINRSVPEDKYLEHMKMQLQILEEEMNITREFIANYDEKIAQAMFKIAGSYSGTGNA